MWQLKVWSSIQCRSDLSLLVAYMTMVTLICLQPFGLSCPEDCFCSRVQDEEVDSALKVSCSKGDMNRIPVDVLDLSVAIFKISSPEDRPNHLRIGPIFTQPVPYVNLREMHIVNSNVPNIGQHSFWGLQNLRLLNLSYNNISSLASENFRGLINLTKLHLDHNRINIMPSETFRHLTALLTLNLAHNNISILMPRLFRMLAKLLYLDLSYNPLQDLNPEVFKDIQELRIFKCRECQLPRINTQIYHLASRLEELDLGKNLFKYLTSDEFISLKKLKNLKLDGNQLAVIVDHIFGKQRQLRSLNLARNRLALLAPASLTNLTSLVNLDISQNKINRFYIQTFAPVVNTLKKINFSGNNIHLDDIAQILQVLPDINEVSMANLSLTNVPPNFFIHNRHITALDISWNKIKDFPNRLLTKMKFLQRLHISHNKIETLDEPALERIETITKVDLSNNPWRCDQCSSALMLMYMVTTTLNETMRHLKCYSPLRLRGKPLGSLTFENLDSCPSTYEAQISVIAGLMLLCIAVLAAVAAALCCTRRRSVHYYVNEHKQRDREIGPLEECQSRTDLGNLATIHAPYYIVSKRSQCS